MTHIQVYTGFDDMKQGLWEKPWVNRRHSEKAMEALWVYHQAVPGEGPVGVTDSLSDRTMIVKMEPQLPPTLILSDLDGHNIWENDSKLSSEFSNRLKMKKRYPLEPHQNLSHAKWDTTLN